MVKVPPWALPVLCSLGSTFATSACKSYSHTCTLDVFATMRGQPIGLLAILAALLLPGAVAVHGVAQQHAACPVREAMRLRSCNANSPPILALRGGSDDEGRAIKFGELASLVADGW